MGRAAGYRFRRTDGNHSEIIKGLRSVGATVSSTARLGEGFPDAVVGFRGANYLLEIKPSDGSKAQRELTEKELQFARGWRGQVSTVDTLEGALKVIGAYPPKGRST